MFADTLHQVHLLFWAQASDCSFDDASKRHLVDRDEAVIVHVGKETHDELTIHAISHTAMTGDGITKVLDLESPLDSRCKETTEGSD